MRATSEQADFAGGCFWGVQDLFDKLPGVTSTLAGYEGGNVASPTYEQVCSHSTGHAETVRVSYNPKLVSYQQLLKHFFTIHDPTQLNGQGVNIGDNYRSVVFYHSNKQKELAKNYIKKLAKELNKPVVTQLEPAGDFWPAEDYHQHYYSKMGIAPHC